MSRFSINDVVELNAPSGKSGTAEKRIGVVVDIFEGPQNYYEVEISNAEGRTIETITLSEDEIRRA